MQVNISTRHGSLSEASQQKIQEKVEKLGKFIERVNLIDVTVDLEKKDQPIVDIRVTTEHKKEFTSNYSSAELFGCVDQAMDKIQQQMKKFKEKMTDHR